MNTITLTEEQVQKITSAIQILNEMVDFTGGNLAKPQEEAKLFYNLKKETREFFKAVFKKFGYAVIGRKDEGLTDLIREHYVNLNAIIRNYEERGVIEISRTAAGRIDCFQFKIKPE